MSNIRSTQITKLKKILIKSLQNTYPVDKRYAKSPDFEVIIILEIF